MRYTLFIFGILCLVQLSCSQTKKESKDQIPEEIKKFESKGQILLENGSGDTVTVKYEFVNEEHFTNFTSQLTKEDFKQIVERASLKSKFNCKYELTYEPTLIELMISNDTLTVFMNYNAKNAFGVPDKLKSYIVFKGTEFVRQF